MTDRIQSFHVAIVSPSQSAPSAPMIRVVSHPQLSQEGAMISLVLSLNERVMCVWSYLAQEMMQRREKSLRPSVV